MVLFRSLKQYLICKYREILKYHFPKKYANVLYYKFFGSEINWNHPVSLNEKINCLAFSSYSKNWHIYADKYRVRDYVAIRGCGDILVPLLSVWDTVDEMDFDSIEGPFVVKLNNGYGDITFIPDKNRISLDEIKSIYRNQMKHRFGIESAEPHYLRIQPKIIAERMLIPSAGGLIDYKFFCFNGEPYCILTASARSNLTHRAKYNIYDLDWNRRPDVISPHEANDVLVERPHCLEEMIKYARILSQGHPFVRMDFYEVDGHVYFGEMTMTPAAGRSRTFTDDFLVELGNQLVF